MNAIPQQQLTQKQLDRLAAMSQLYSDAKTILAVQTTLSIPLVVIWSLLVLKFPGFRVYAAYWGIAVTFLDVLVFTPWQKGLKKKAALIQELFDCDVLQMEWQDLKSGRPGTEEILKAASKFKLKDPNYSRLRDWYPVSVGQLPIHLARLVCQRANCWWDAELRRRYAFWVIAVVIALTIIVFLIGLIGGLTLEKFFLVVLAPLSPALVLGMRQYIEHRESANVLDHLKINAERLWNQAIQGKLSSTKATKESRNLQDEIFINRCRSPLIFNWIYRLLRQEHEERMNKAAEALVEEALRSS